jgi:hypothetical protein
MKNICGITVVAALAIMVGPASAQSRHQNTYEMVTTHEEQSASFGAFQRQHDLGRHRSADKVIILDKGTGALWAWSERQQSVMYLGQIFPLAGRGTVARIIEVNPEQKSP